MVLCATINYSFLYSSLLQLFELLLDTYQGTLLPPLLKKTFTTWRAQFVIVK